MDTGVAVTARILVVAGTGSGVGKTSVSVGLARALCQRGLRVRAAKVGPDFLDPMYLTAATGRPCLNLDTYMMGEAYVRDQVTQAAADADLVLIEGVMGLFDGVRPTSSKGSTAEVARLLDAPILLVADARGQARSFAATVHGFANLQPDLRVAGVIANQVGSAGHGTLLEAALASLDLPPLVGAIRAGALPHLPSRHLGLIAPEEYSVLDALGAAVEPAISLEALLRLAQPVRLPPSAAPPAAAAKSAPGLRLAVAEDAAFGFIYADLRESIVAQGAEWIPFSPLRDQAVPEGADAILIPGGYPEEHADELSQNRSFLASLRDFANRRPVYAECGGLMLLGESLVDRRGLRFTMSGVLPLSLGMGQRAAQLGYSEVRLVHNSLWGRVGMRCRGHEFHYSFVEPSSLRESPPAIGCDPPMQRCYDVQDSKGTSRREGYQRRRVLGSYVHLHFASRPDCLTYFLRELAQ